PKEPTEEVKIEFEKGVATGNEKCNFCKGKIKAGLAIIKCKCGAVYHEPCAKRVGKCNACSTSFEEKVVAKKLPALKL
ncbi:MAG: RING finger protein, partial [Thermoplasmata archaeon]